MVLYFLSERADVYTERGPLSGERLKAEVLQAALLQREPMEAGSLEAEPLQEEGSQHIQ